MNKKQKTLTLVALVVFSLMMYLHYPHWLVWHIAAAAHGSANYYGPQPVIKDVRMPLFVLAVFYVGLFFVLGTNRTKNRAPNP